MLALACGLASCRGVLGIDDSALPDPDAADGGADSGSMGVGDGAVAADVSSKDAGLIPDALSRDAGCTTCADGGCQVDNDCADPIRGRCSNGMWGTDKSFVCIARDVWGTLHADLPTGTIDFTEQYWGDVSHQTGSTLIRVQVDKGATAPFHGEIGVTVP